MHLRAQVIVAVDCQLRIGGGSNQPPGLALASLASCVFQLEKLAKVPGFWPPKATTPVCNCARTVAPEGSDGEVTVNCNSCKFASVVGAVTVNGTSRAPLAGTSNSICGVATFQPPLGRKANVPRNG